MLIGCYAICHRMRSCVCYSGAHPHQQNEAADTWLPPIFPKMYKYPCQPLTMFIFSLAFSSKQTQVQTDSCVFVSLLNVFSIHKIAADDDFVLFSSLNAISVSVFYFGSIIGFFGEFAVDRTRHICVKTVIVQKLTVIDRIEERTILEKCKPTITR